MFFSPLENPQKMYNNVELNSHRRDDNLYLESALRTKKNTHVHNSPILPTIFQYNPQFSKMSQLTFWKIVSNTGKLWAMGKFFSSECTL